MALRIGMFGGGVVGGGVYKLLERPLPGCVSPGRVVKLCVRDPSKPRDFELEAHTEVVTDFASILEDDSIDCIVELMGGVTHAKDVVFRALEKGKSVVTANKALLAQYLPDIETLLSKNPGARLGYEAAVCGGIPIIRALQEDFVADEITSLSGIMNGTTNFILSKMETEGADYGKVLAEAQSLGFAEADPTADVEGHDVQAKVSLLAKLAFGQSVPLSSVPCSGISSIGAADFSGAKALNCTVKLLGTAAKTSSGGLSVSVSPVLVPLSHTFASAQGAGNIVVVTSKNMGDSSFSGPGAGRFPTANSVMNDLVRLSLGTGGEPFPRKGQYAIEQIFSARFYVRIDLSLEVDYKDEIAKAAKDVGIGPITIMSAKSDIGAGTEVVLTTDESCSNTAISAFCDSIVSACKSKQKPACIKML
jgi:homoserine dehydrogenase